MSLDIDLIEIGHIAGAHGVKGQVKVYSNTHPRENIVTYSPWIIQQGGLQTSVEVSGNSQGKHVVARIEGVVDRNQAEDMTGARILIDKKQLPNLQAGDYYWSQLIGLSVLTTSGQDLGHIEQMLETGANDVMVVQGEQELLIPYVMDEVIKSIDLKSHLMVVDWDSDF